MSVIAEISLPGDEFELGRILDLTSEETVELESLVPAESRSVPYFWIHGGDVEAFAERLAAKEEVIGFSVIDDYDDRALCALEWSGDGIVFRTVSELEAYILRGVGTADAWRFELRFSSRDSLSTFREICQSGGLSFEVLRIYNPERPDLGPWYGLTERQREAIVLAVESGYYDIPRDCTTVELADELGISDQAVTERLRRAIATLVGNTLLTSPSE